MPLSKLIALQARKTTFGTGAELYRQVEVDAELRKDIAELSYLFLNKTLGGCRNCYADAFIQLMRLKPEEMAEKADCPFELRRGALLQDVVNFDISLNVTQANITTEKALYHLKTNPKCAELFARLPDDWQQQAEAHQLPQDKKPAQGKRKKKNEVEI